MRTVLSIPLALTVVLLFTAAPAPAGPGGAATGRMPVGWDGFPVGTMIQHKTKSVVTVPGMPAPRQTVSEERKTLLRVTEKSYVLKVETREGSGPWTSKEVTEPRLSKEDLKDMAARFRSAMGPGAKVKLEDIGEESVTIEGKTYPCKTKRMTYQAGPMGEMSAKVWISEEHGMLKMKGSGMASITMEVKKLATPVTAAGHTFTCRQTEMKMGTMGGTTQRFESKDVPEGLVRTTTTMKQGPMSMENTTELVGFRKGAATTPK